MEGTITVEEGAEDDGEPTSTEPVLPDQAVTLAVGTIATLVSVVFLAYFFSKYGGVRRRWIAGRYSRRGTRGFRG